MAERVAAISKKSETKQTCSNSCKQKPDLYSSGLPVDRVLQLQKTAGNQAVQRLIKSKVLQAKSTINQPVDRYEQEADQIANQVLAIPAYQATTGTFPYIPSFASSSNRQIKAPSANIDQTRAGPGKPLESGLRQDMEQRFGHDFSQVRVHSDGEAANAANAIQARAYTFGNNIVFGQGEYAPATMEGKSLLAHELVHVVQQSGEGSPKIQRKAANHPRDRCGTERNSGPCADWSTALQKARLKKYIEKAKDDEMGRGLNTVAEVLKSPVSPGERMQLLRIACCQLEPKDAEFLNNVFSERRGTAGKAFGNLSTQSRCAILSILDDRAAAAGRALGLEVRQAITSEVDWAERIATQEAAGRAAAEAQWKRDIELHAKAGRTTWFDVVFPGYARIYRIPYASRIQHPVLRQSGQLAERTATVSIGRAALDPITRPIEAVINFIECMISSVKGKDVGALGNRFGLKVALMIPTVFPAGAVVGATKEIGSIAKEIASIISDPAGFVKELGNFLKLMWSPDSNEIACAMGQDVGEQLSAQIGSIAKLDDHELVYELGKLAGPLLLNTLLAIVAPEIVASLKGTRVAKRLLALLEDLGDKIKFLEKWRAKRRVHPSQDLPSTKIKELTAADAMEYIEKHPPKMIINQDKPGHRRAPVGGGHEIIEVSDKNLPTGIGCEFRSNGGPRVPCPKGMGILEVKSQKPEISPQVPHRETVEEFQKRGGKIEYPKVPKRKQPKPEITAQPKSEPMLPKGFEDMPEPRIKTRINLEEDHHIATRYRKENQDIFKQAGLSIDDDLNLIKDFPEHGQLRGWYKWEDRSYKFVMKGHHKKYNEWVTGILRKAVPLGLAPDQSLDRITKVTRKLDTIIRQHPEVLSHGPGILPLELQHLKFDWE